MKKLQVIYKEGDHQWAVVARDPEKPGFIIDTNEYLIASGDNYLLCDPGGMEVFPAVFSAVSAQFDARKISMLFASHQDPDIISSLSLWLNFNPDIKCYLSWLWSGFVPHFGGDGETFVKIPDPGMEIEHGNLRLQAIPAHYLHSSGNFNLYDPKARILFSGDIGAALQPPGEDYLFVEDFDSHIRYAEGFHKRWMGSNEAKNQWCERVSRLDIDMLCPQHGAIFRGADVKRFIDWLYALRVGQLHE